MTRLGGGRVSCRLLLGADPCHLCRYDYLSIYQILATCLVLLIHIFEIDKTLITININSSCFICHVKCNQGAHDAYRFDEMAVSPLEIQEATFSPLQI